MIPHRSLGMGYIFIHNYEMELVVNDIHIVILDKLTILILFLGNRDIMRQNDGFVSIPKLGTVVFLIV